MDAPGPTSNEAAKVSVPRSGVRQPARTTAELEAIERAILDWAVALRARYETCAAGPLD